MKVFKSDGMGVESVAITLRWLLEPECRDFSLEDLIIGTAMTGDEHATTVELYQRHILPLYRKHGVRYVQLARRGPHVEDGIVVLDDSRATQRLYAEGVHKLSQELLSAGTVPQFAQGKRLCSVKFKGWPLDTWLERQFGPRVLVALPEPAPLEAGSVIYRMTKRQRKKLEKGAHIPTQSFRHVMGYNAEEEFRITRDKSYSTEDRLSEYPLQVWRWTREKCEQYIFEKLGVWWPKSCCKWCPFTRGKEDAIERMLREGNALEALLVEHTSLALNPRSTLYATGTLYERILERAPGEVEKFQDQLRRLPWAVYRVRRVYHAKGRGDREVTTLYTGSMVGARRELVRLAPKAETSAGSLRAWFRVRVKDAYPATEEMLVACPQVPQDKARGNFESSWQHALANPGVPPEVAPTKQLPLIM